MKVRILALMACAGLCAAALAYADPTSDLPGDDNDNSMQMFAQNSMSGPMQSDNSSMSGPMDGNSSQTPADASNGNDDMSADTATGDDDY